MRDDRQAHRCLTEVHILLFAALCLNTTWGSRVGLKAKSCQKLHQGLDQNSKIKNTFSLNFPSIQQCNKALLPHLYPAIAPSNPPCPHREHPMQHMCMAQSCPPFPHHLAGKTSQIQMPTAESSPKPPSGAATDCQARRAGASPLPCACVTDAHPSSCKIPACHSTDVLHPLCTDINVSIRCQAGEREVNRY